MPLLLITPASHRTSLPSYNLKCHQLSSWLTLRSTMEPRNLSFDDYTIGWICALPVELEAAQLIFKTTHPLPSIPNDRNIYHSAQFGPDNIIIACFPGDETGTDSPTKAVTRFLSTFQRLRFYLMVGIGSGIPSQTMDIRLGDIVVSEPKTESVGVIQFEM